PGGPRGWATRGDFWRFLRGRLLSSDKDVVAPEGHALSAEEAAAGWEAVRGDKLQWLGHSAFRWQLGGTVLLSDPLLTDRASPFRWAGPKRFIASPLGPEEAGCDVVLITHCHYDHLDLRTLRRLGRREFKPGAVGSRTGIGGRTLPFKPRERGALGDRTLPFEPGEHGALGDSTLPFELRERGALGDRTPRWSLRVVVPLGVGRMVRRSGLTDITELDWHEPVTVGDGVTVTLVPAVHFAARTVWDRDWSLWGGYVVRRGDLRVYLSGDTAYHPTLFREMGERYGPLDYGLVPIGAYEPQAIMVEHHATPEEGVAIGRDVQARRLIGHHWGALRLTTEDPFEPPGRFREAARQAGFADEAAVVMRIGETRALMP
ncbi:MAG TPA: MBL fold metallo-hydrolase, partial [Prosthecobacter sp.]|nr:MBL fold metallo-hydrolase [Prosthecobacter sp.]